MAALDEADAVLGEVAEGIHHRVDRVHGGRARSRDEDAGEKRGREQLRGYGWEVCLSLLTGGPLYKLGLTTLLVQFVCPDFLSF